MATVLDNAVEKKKENKFTLLRKWKALKVYPEYREELSFLWP